MSFFFTYVPRLREGGYLTATILNALTVLQLLWHLNDREMLIIVWYVLKYFFLLHVFRNFELVTGFVCNIRDIRLSYNLSRLITENVILTL